MLDDLFGAFVAAEMLNSPLGRAAIGIVAVFGIAAGVHYAYDANVYGDELDAARTEIAEAAVKACGDGTEASKRNGRIFREVQQDLEKYKGTLAWMPNKSAAEQLKLTKDFGNMVLYPTTFSQRVYSFDNGVQGVLYNEGETQPVFVYNSLERSQFNAIMARLKEHGVPEGNAVIRWNSIDKNYDIINVPPGESSVTVNHTKIDIKTNPCHMDDGLKGIGKQILKNKGNEVLKKLRGFIPGGQ